MEQRQESASNQAQPQGKADAKLNRREFFRTAGRGLGACLLAGISGRWLWMRVKDDPGFSPQTVWKIDPGLCVQCGQCATACVRTPSAVKAFNDENLCSNCVVCYGHIRNHGAPSPEIDRQPKVCPQNAVTRIPFAGGMDGYYLYRIDEEKCVGCGLCVQECNHRGSQSMFLMIRPDLCLGCNECAIARVCPQQAISRMEGSQLAAAQG